MINQGIRTNLMSFSTRFGFVTFPFVSLSSFTLLIMLSKHQCLLLNNCLSVDVDHNVSTILANRVEKLYLFVNDI